jgi:hypothetical protein
MDGIAAYEAAHCQYLLPAAAKSGNKGKSVGSASGYAISSTEPLQM